MNSDTWICIASGPSLTKADVNLTRGFKTIAINDNYLMAPWANVLYACDRKWWDLHHLDIKGMEFAGEKWAWEHTTGEDCAAITKHQLKTVSVIGQAGLGRKKYEVYSGGNSGYQAIQLAAHFGAKKIILLGTICKKQTARSTGSAVTHKSWETPVIGKHCEDILTS